MTQQTTSSGAASDHAALWQRLQQSALQPALWLALAEDYVRCALPWQAAYAARQALRLDAAPGTRLRALDIETAQDTGPGDAALGRPALPDAAAMAQRFSARVSECPGDWLTWLYLARLQEMAMPVQCQPVQAASAADTSVGALALQRAQALEPVPGESLHWMGVWRLNAGDGQGAVQALSALLDIRPMRYGSMMYLGEALLRTGNTAAAEKAFARASLSSNADFLQTLAARVYAHNYWQEAIAVLQKALGLRPANAPILLALAKIQSDVYLLTDCRESLRQVRALQPHNAELRVLEAGLPGRMGDAKGHLQRLQADHAARGDPLSRTASSIAMTLLYQDTLSATVVANWHRRLCAPIEAAVPRKTEFANARTPQRRLRVGFITGDLHRQHPVNIFMLPLLQRFDHRRFEICLYYTGAMHDAYTREARACADRWLDAAALDDAGLHQAMVTDQIDILIDLAGHTASHRLGVLAMRAAPVQATFLGYPHSTGLATIDWLIGDAVVSPADHAHLYSEGIAQLPASVFCWSPVDAYPLPPPRRPDAPVVFGSFNNAMKLSPRTIALWSRVLLAVPHSQLLLKAPALRDDAVRARFAAMFEAQGIAPERLHMRGPSGLAEMMQEYRDMDIGLDPLPYNGGTTTLQALWMGVPVVCLTGDNFVGRMGASFMHALGRPEWAAADEPAYVAAALRLAHACAALRAGRAQLREQMAASPLCDIRNYVSHFESLLARMWAIYCAGESVRIIRAGECVSGARA